MDTEYYINKQGDKMVRIPYESSACFQDVEKCSFLYQLENKLYYTEMAVSYWQKKEDDIQVSFFQSQVNHIIKRYKSLAKQLMKIKLVSDSHGYRDYDVSDTIIKRCCPPFMLQKGDMFNVHYQTVEQGEPVKKKTGVFYDGISVESTLIKAKEMLSQS